MNQSALSLSVVKMKLFQRLLLTWMIVWLPVAGAMAAVMPLSGAIASSPTPFVANSDGDDTAAMPCHGKATFGQACSHCMLCHLAGALMMPGMPVIATLLPTNVFTAAPHLPHPSFIPEPAYPPPRAYAA